MSKRVLVTGLTGFIGRQSIKPLLESGFEVTAVLPEGQGCPAEIACYRADLLNRQAIERAMLEIRPEYLLHFAWYVTPGKFWSSVENVRWAAASLDLFLSFAQGGGRRFVGAGTCAEYDWTGAARCVESATPLRPATLYGVCKNSTREVLESAASTLGVEFAWGRIFHLYGPYEPPGRLVSSLASALVEGREALCSSGEQVRDFLHVADVARAFVALLDSSECGAVNIASGEGVSIAEVAGALADCAGRPELLRLGAIPSRSGEPEVLVGDTARLRRTGFVPRLGLKAGLTETVQWWRSRQG